MSDAMYGFATGFAQGFSQTYSARLQAEAAEKRDKIRFGAQAWLKQEDRYNSAKKADEAIMQQAEALVSSESLIPKDAVVDVYNMLKSGRTPKMIIDDVRTAGAKFESLPSPQENTELVVPENDQTDALLGGEDTSLSTAAMNTGDKVVNPDEVALADTSSAPKKDDPNNPFTEYRTDIREAVGQTEGDYFDQVLSGYTSPTRKSKYKFTPGVTKTDIPSLESLLSQSVYNSTEFKEALATNDTDKQQELIIAGIQAKKGDTSKSLFGTGEVASIMNIWALTDAGRNAVENGDVNAIAKEWARLDSQINPESASTSGEAKKDFDLSDLENSFLNVWERSDAGKKAMDEGDVDAITEATVAAHEQAQNVRTSLNKGYGFDPSKVTQLSDIPGLREQFAKYPVVLQQLNNIEEGLLSAKRAETDAGDKGKDHTVYGIVDGKLSVIGTGTRRGGKLFMNGEEVPAEDASKFYLSSVDNPIDAEKIAASDWVKKKDKLYGSVDFANTALVYLAELEQNPLARTYVARFASGVGEVLNELQALKDISTIVNENGEELIDRDLLIQQIENNPAFDNFSAGVRSIIAQETALIFDVARAEGNSGHALSNKDYDNYFRSIFNSNDPKVIQANIERKVGLSFKAAVAGAKSIGNNPGMKYAVTGTGIQWWQTPKETVLQGRDAPVRNFINESLDRVTKTVEGSSYGTTPEQKFDAYIAGEEITVDQELVDAYPSLAPLLGKKIKAPSSGDNQ